MLVSSRIYMVHSSIRTVRTSTFTVTSCAMYFDETKNSLKRVSQRPAGCGERKRKNKIKQKEFNGQRVALRAKWSSHSNACGCLRHTFFFYGLRRWNMKTDMTLFICQNCQHITIKNARIYYVYLNKNECVRFKNRKLKYSTIRFLFECQWHFKNAW